jgi:hypothetical protein
MYDDGTNGDAVPGDNTFSYNLATSASTPGGNFSLPFTITDAQSRSGSGNISLRIVTPPQWDETANGGSDAGDLPASAQTPTGTNPFSVLTGNIEATSDADMYFINVCDLANFSATTTNPDTTGDTQLFLFNEQGLGVVHNDDNPAGGLTSRITGALVPAPGNYYIAVSRYNRDPVDEGGNLLWNNTPFNTERAPDGPGAFSAVAAWLGNSGSAGAYRLEMTGACFAGGSPPCNPDYNDDGNVDQDDVAYLVNVVAGGNNPTGRDPDFNLDGNVDQGDVAALIDVVAGGPCP